MQTASVASVFNLDKNDKIVLLQYDFGQFCAWHGAAGGGATFAIPLLGILKNDVIFCGLVLKTPLNFRSRLGRSQYTPYNLV